MKYTEMTNEQLAVEIVRVRNLIFSKCNSHTYHQNKKYLAKLEKEWGLRHGKS